MFKPSPGAWLQHPQLGLAFVARDASISNVGFRDLGFTAVSFPTGNRVWVLASSCTPAGPPRGMKPRAVVTDEAVRLPADCEPA